MTGPKAEIAVESPYRNDAEAGGESATKKQGTKVEIVIDPLGRVYAAGDLREAEGWEAEYLRSRDATLLVLAVGQSPDNPPEWVLRACRQVYEEHRRHGEGYKDDGPDLDRIADLLVSGEAKTLHAAVRAVTGEEADGTDFARLYRQWNREMRRDPSGARKARALLRLAHLLPRTPDGTEE